MINLAILEGRITKEVDIKKTQSGISVASFTIAVEDMKDKEGNKKVNFINCVAWRYTADFMEKYIHKGDLISVQGKIQVRNYDGTDGKKVYVTEVVADSVHILSSKKETVPTKNNFEDFNAGPALNISSDDLPF